MSLLGPSFLTGLEGSGCVTVARGGPSTDLAWFRFGTNAAVLYDLSELRPRTVLSVPSHIKLTTGVVYCPVLDSHIVVFDDKQLVVFQQDFGSEETSSSSGRDVQTLLDTCATTLPESVVDVVASDQDVYLVFNDGSVQTVSHCVKSKHVDEQSQSQNIYVNKFSPRSHQVQRLGTSVFRHEGRLYSSHIFRVVHPRTKVGGPITVKSFRLALDTDTQRCKQTPHTSAELSKDAASVARVGAKLVTADSNGSLHVSSLFSPETRRPVNSSGLDKVEFVSRLSDSKAAVIGTRSSGEGYAVAVVDITFDGGIVVSGPVKVKAVSAEGGNLLNCQGEKRIFFKHGARMATLFAEGMPSTLADMVGRTAFEKAETSQPPLNGPWKVIDQPSQSLELYQRLPNLLGPEGSLESVLDGYTDIPELLVLNTVEAMVRSDSPNMSLLSQAFAVPVSEPALLQHLRNSDFSLAQAMLRQLLSLVQVESLEVPNDEDKFERHLAWMSCILNAHYANFLMCPEAADLLEQALDTVDVLEANVTSMGETMAVVKLIRDKQMVQMDYSTKNYSIEMVDL